MQMIRLILALLAIALFFIISLPLLGILCLIGLKNPMLRMKLAQPVVSAAFRLILFVTGTKRQVLGVEQLPEGAVLFVGNHRSYLDIPIFYTSMKKLTGFIAKKEIARVPFLHAWMRQLDCLFLDRDNMRQGLKTILQGIEQIKQGFSVFIMPEGTRNHAPEMLPFKEGSFKMAEKTDCPIVPVSITNSDSIYELHKPFVKRAKVIIRFGKPIRPSELPPEERKFLGARLRTTIEEMQREDRALFEGQTGVYRY